MQRSYFSAIFVATITHILIFGGTLSCLASGPFDAKDSQDSAEIHRQITAVRCTVPPKLDGTLSDPVWKNASIASRFYDRIKGGLATDQTTVYILYDNSAIYVGFRMDDREPNKIVGIETARDSKYNQNSSVEDSVEVSFDPYHSTDGSGFFRFSVNALGTPSAKLGAGRNSKVEWQGQWNAIIHRDSKGWTAEMRIPWQCLNYPKGRQNYGLNFERYRASSRTDSFWSNVGTQFFNEYEGNWVGVTAPNPPAPKVALLPYVLTKVGETQPGLNFGVDARYAITPNLTAVASLNPDFGTIENAVLGINFSRSERLLDERRPFFLEGSADFSNGNFSDLGQFFYSQRISDFDMGAKIYGQVDKQDQVGFLNTNTFGSREDNIFHFRHNLTDLSRVELFVSQKYSSFDNSDSFLLSQQNKQGKLGYSANFAQSRGTNGNGDGENLGLSYSDKFVFWYLQASHLSPNLRFADGYIPFTDFKGLNLYANYNNEFKKGFIRNFFVEQSQLLNWTNAGVPFQRGGTIDGSFDTRSDFELTYAYTRQAFFNQQDNNYSVGLTKGISDRFHQLGVNFGSGIIAGQKYTFFGPQFQTLLAKHLSVAYTGAIQGLGSVDQLHILTMNYDITSSRSIGGRLVVRNGQTNWYLSYKRSGEKGTSIYLIIGDPNATTFQNILQLKIVVPFNL